MTEEIINLLDCPAMEYIAVGNQYFCKLNSCDCDKIRTCGYKRLEQECDELKKACEKCKLFDIEKTNRGLLERIDKLKQENEKLKKKLEFDEVQLNSYFIGEEKICKENEKYRSALEEILESAKFAQCLPCGSGNLEDCLNCNDDTTNNGQFCMEKRIHDIKTKCVEVLKYSEE